MKKKLLVYAHYFYPDVASTGQILTELCEGMQNEFDITVICVVPSYMGKIDEEYKTKRIFKEKYRNINILRVRVPEFDKKNKVSRIKNITAYFINAIIATFQAGPQDIVFSISQPPILGGIIGVIGKIIKRAKFIYNIQDFNPEQVMAVGYSQNKLLINIAMGLDKLSCRQADKVIVVGRDMQETLRKRFNNKNVPDNVFINNWIDEKEIYPLPLDNLKVLDFKKKYGLLNKLVIMYSGNIGLYYDLENLIKVIEKFKDRNNVVFAFIGEGTVKGKIEKYVQEHKIDNVKFIPYQDKENLIYSLNAADVHLVVNSKGIKGVSVPSKLYGVMAAGKTVFGVLDKGSEARLLVEESGCGKCVEPGDYGSIRELIEKTISNKDIDFGIKGRKYLEMNLTKSVSVEKYINTIEDISENTYEQQLF